jgi:hypothetical protein
MSTHPVRALAAEAARTVGRRLRARRRGGGQVPARVRGHVGPAPQPEVEPIPLPLAALPAEAAAEDAELDALRGALVRELDRLAADDDCSASFRRAS